MRPIVAPEAAFLQRTISRHEATQSIQYRARHRHVASPVRAAAVRHCRAVAGDTGRQLWIAYYAASAAHAGGHCPVGFAQSGHLGTFAAALASHCAGIHGAHNA